jgi:rhodanese-related sulfurtransferase
MRSITVQTLKQKLEDKEEIHLIDVREPFEHDDFNLGGQLIPLGEITQQVGIIPTDKEVVLYCHRGIRSQVAIQRLMEKFPFTNLSNLVGGTAAWESHFGRVV